MNGLENEESFCEDERTEKEEEKIVI